MSSRSDGECAVAPRRRERTVRTTMAMMSTAPPAAAPMMMGIESAVEAELDGSGVAESTMHARWSSS